MTCLHSILGLYTNLELSCYNLGHDLFFLSIIVMDSTFLLPLCISEGHYAQMMEWADNNLTSLTKANAVSCPWGRVPSYICCPAGLVATIQSGTQRTVSQKRVHILFLQSSLLIDVFVRENELPRRHRLLFWCVQSGM